MSVRSFVHVSGGVCVAVAKGAAMTESEVRQLLYRAVQYSDADAMREAIDRVFAGGKDALSAEAEYQLRHEDYVMEMPQSGERIRGREAMRLMQETYPTPPTITIRRVIGSGPVWVVEGVNDYDGDVWHVIVVLELDEEGRFVRDTRYYSKSFDPPAWRASWVEPI
jgi:hypothetical protein